MISTLLTVTLLGSDGGTAQSGFGFSPGETPRPSTFTCETSEARRVELGQARTTASPLVLGRSRVVARSREETDAVEGVYWAGDVVCLHVGTEARCFDPIRGQRVPSRTDPTPWVVSEGSPPTPKLSDGSVQGAPGDQPLATVGTGLMVLREDGVLVLDPPLGAPRPATAEDFRRATGSTILFGGRLALLPSGEVLELADPRCAFWFFGGRVGIRVGSPGRPAAGGSSSGIRFAVAPDGKRVAVVEWEDPRHGAPTFVLRVHAVRPAAAKK